MKYLKLFESIGDGYQAISYIELVTILTEHLSKHKVYLPISDSEVEILNGLYKEYRVTIAEHTGSMGSNTIYMDSQINNKTLIINQLPDEWFYVRILFDGKVNYKCDQWDGLINCLRDNI